MSRFLLLLTSGPCMGTYETARAPHALRAVRARGGKLDVLDLLEDQPTSDEELFLYQQIEGSSGHMCGRGRGGCQVTLSYRYVGPLDRETGEVAELSDRDREWWEGQRKVALAAWSDGKPHEAIDPPQAVAEPAQGTLL